MDTSDSESGVASGSIQLAPDLASVKSGGQPDGDEGPRYRSLDVRIAWRGARPLERQTAVLTKLVAAAAT